MLAQAGNDVTLIEVRTETVERINTSGLRVNDKAGKTATIGVRATDSPADVGVVDLIVVSHAAADHLGDTESIARRTGAPVICGGEVKAYPTAKGIPATQIRATTWGIAVEVAGIKVQPVECHHWSQIRMPDGTFASGVPMAFVIDVAPGVRFYHYGDTAIFSDMKLQAELYQPTIGCVGIANPIAIGVQACRRGDVRAGEYVLILGAGPIGLALIEVALAGGARPVVADINESRLEFARTLGAQALKTDDSLLERVRDQTNGDGAPVVIEATGTLQAMEATPESDVMPQVFGYTILHDVSARDVQFKDNQITLGKNFDTFCPLGPCIVTTDELTDPGNVKLRSFVNGQLMQDGSTADWVFPLPKLLSFLSHVMTLEPGDVVSTGTPAGEGAFRKPPLFLKPGDVVRLEIEGIGTLENGVIESDS